MIIKFKEWVKKSDVFMRIFYVVRFFAYGNRKKINGRGNKILYKNALLKDIRIKIIGNDNMIVFGDSASVKQCNIQIIGNNHTLELGKNTVFVQTNFAFEDHHNLIQVGERSRILHHGLISAVEPYSKIEIGNDCMFSTHVDVRNTDSHSIIDLQTGARINKGSNVKIGNKVWLGAHVQVLKGVAIGNNSVVGIRSLVTKDIPANCIAAGVPAKVIRTNVDWTEERL